MGLDIEWIANTQHVNGTPVCDCRGSFCNFNKDAKTQAQCIGNLIDWYGFVLMCLNEDENRMYVILRPPPVPSKYRQFGSLRGAPKEFTREELTHLVMEKYEQFDFDTKFGPIDTELVSRVFDKAVEDGIICEDPDNPGENKFVRNWM